MRKNTKRRRRTIVGPATDVPFGELIRQAFVLSGMSSREFADRLGVKQPRVFEIFRNESTTEALVDRCMAALDVELEVRIVRCEP